MECASSNKQHIIRLHRAVFRIDHASFDNRQNIPLYSFKADVRSVSHLVAGDLVALVNENNPVLFRPADRFFLNGVIVD